MDSWSPQGEASGAELVQPLWSAPAAQWLTWEEKYVKTLKMRADALPDLQNRLQSITEAIHRKKFMTTAQLSKIMKFKLLRGKFRPGLQQKVEANPNNTTKKCTKEAFGKVGRDRPTIEDLKETVQIISCDLKGVGPATASLIISLWNPHVPFLADEAYRAAGLGKPRYTLKEYLAFVEKIWEKCDELENADLLPSKMVDYLWAHEFVQNPVKRESKKKRKASKSKKQKKKRKIG